MGTRWRITGLTVPWFGLQWEYLDGDAEIARRVISILEDKRMLWTPYADEVHEHVLESAGRVRDALTEQINTKGIGLELATLLKQLRKLFANFMTPQTRYDSDFAAHRPVPFMESLGALRAAVGERIAALASKYSLDVDDDLQSIVPDTGSWFFEPFDA